MSYVRVIDLQLAASYCARKQRNMMIDTTIGLIPEHAIERIADQGYFDSNGKRCWRKIALLKDGGAPIVHEPLDLEDKFLPCPPGWYAIFEQYSSEDPGLRFAWKVPILAWHIHNGWLQPVTIDGLLSEDSKMPAFLCPDGKVYEPDGGLFGSEAEYLNYRAERANLLLEKEGESKQAPQ